MADNLPSRRIDRDALERIIQRAAELQAGEMDTGEGMTEGELLKLGTDVGIDGRFLRRAMYEEGAGAVTIEKGIISRLFGPNVVSAGRVVPGDKATIESELAHWMTEGEALAIKRRMPDRTVWEQQKGFFAHMKRGFGVGGRSYQLARAVDVTVAVTQLEPGFCHVEISADVSAMRSGAAGGAFAVGGTMAVMGAVLLSVVHSPTLAMQVIAMVPIGAGVASPFVGGRMQRTRSGHMQLALEQVLDRLEHGEIRPRHQSGAPSPFMKIAVEIRTAIAEGIEHSRQHQKRLR